MVCWKKSKKGSTGGQRMRGLFFVCFWVYIMRYQWGLGGDPQKKSETGKIVDGKKSSWYFLVGEFESLAT